MTTRQQGRTFTTRDADSLKIIERDAICEEAVRFGEGTPEVRARLSEETMEAWTITDGATSRTHFVAGGGIMKRAIQQVEYHLADSFHERLERWKHPPNATRDASQNDRGAHRLARWLARKAFPVAWRETLRFIERSNKAFQDLQAEARRTATSFAETHSATLKPPPTQVEIDDLARRLFEALLLPSGPDESSMELAARKNPILRDAMRAYTEWRATLNDLAQQYDPSREGPESEKALERVNRVASRQNAVTHTRTFAFHWPKVVHEWQVNNAASLGVRRALASALKTEARSQTPEAEARLREATATELAREEFVSGAGWPWPIHHEEAEADAMAAPLAKLFRQLRARFCPTGKGPALARLRDLERTAKQALVTWKTQERLDGIEPPESPWQALTPTLAASIVAQVVWFDRVCDALEREVEKEHGVVRVGRDLTNTFAQARLWGGRVESDEQNQRSILVEPPSGTALILPFDEGLMVSRNGSGLVGLRQVLSPRAQRTYLAGMVLYQDQKMRPDGSFETDGPASFLDVTGATRHEDNKGSRTYKRFASKDLKTTAADLALFSRIRVRSVGNLEAAAGDPLLDEIKDRRSGKRAFYAHSRLVVGQLHSDYFRIPRAVCRLSINDIPLAMGIAQILRTQMVRHLKSGAAIEAPIGDWLEAAGVNAKEHVRKEGRKFWPAIADDLARVAGEGKLGELTWAGREDGLILTLAPEATLQKSYHPLLEASQAHAKAKTKARIADHRQKQRPGRS